MEDRSSLLAELEARRLALGLTQVAFAEDRLGIDRSTWANIRAGRQMPSRKTLGQIMSAFPTLESIVLEFIRNFAKEGKKEKEA